MKSRKTKLDAYFALFNCHLNNAKERARKEFIEKYGLSTWEREIQPIIDAGIVSIFQQSPNEWTQFYVDTVTRIVNEDREPESETISSEENMRKVQDSVFAVENGLDRTTIPHGSTVVNVFPGDLRDWLAGMAMSGMMGNPSYFGVYNGPIPWESLSKEFYQLADAMLNARANSTEGER